MSSIRDKTGTLTYKQQLKNIGKAIGLVKPPKVVKDSKGRVIDTSPKRTPKKNIKTKKIYYKKRKPSKEIQYAKFGWKSGVNYLKDLVD